MADFVSFAREQGLLLEHAAPVSRIKYVPTVLHPKKKRGSYWFDGQRGWVCAHDAETGVVWFNDKDSKPWTEADKRVWREKKHAAQLALAKDQQEAADRAQAVLNTCKVMPHGYLRLKGFPDQRTLVTPQDDLFLPMRDVRTNVLLGSQTIHWNPQTREWGKKYEWGMRAGGAVLWMGPLAPQETWLVEGYATGLSVLAAIEMTRLSARVCVCFSAHNLAKVAPLIPGTVYVFADNDASGTGQKAATASGRPWTMPDEVETDANDLHQEMGIYAVSAKLMEVRQ